MVYLYTDDVDLLAPISMGFFLLRWRESSRMDHVSISPDAAGPSREIDFKTAEQGLWVILKWLEK